MTRSTELLIIGAGPFGLAASAYAQHVGIDHVIVGEPMAFWKAHMPKGMLLRSACDWHLDPTDEHTIARYLSTLRLTPSDVEPLSVDFYLGYCDWFMRQKRITVSPSVVIRLDRGLGNDEWFEATMHHGEVLRARRVLLAIGMSHFANVPEDLAAMLSPGRFGHTCDTVDFTRFARQRMVIVGGRQSAFEWAALLADGDAEEVHVVYRHDTPEFIASDWHFVDPLMDLTATVPGWFRHLPPEEREAVAKRFWAEGRLKLEPWLTPRLDKPSVHRWPHESVVACAEAPGGEIQAELSDGTRLMLDYVVLATGYKPDMRAVPYLSGVIDAMDLVDGFPVLDDNFQSSVPGLFVTGFPATRDFGPFFGFVRGCPVAATLTTAGLKEALSQR